MEAYCVKCKEKREMGSAEAVFTKTGTPATRGVCSICGTKMFRMGKTEAHEGLTPPENTKRKAKEPKPRKGKLVIVESPAKARTIGRYLGDDYKVVASFGHVRDLLRSKLSIDIENNFEPKSLPSNAPYRPFRTPKTMDLVHLKHITQTQKGQTLLDTASEKVA